MKTILLALTLFAVGCKESDSPVNVTVEDSTPVMTISFESRVLYTTTNNQFFYSTYSVTNNSSKTLDSAKVTFYTNGSFYTSFTFTKIKPSERNSMTVYHLATATIKTSVEWW